MLFSYLSEWLCHFMSAVYETTKWGQCWPCCATAVPVSRGAPASSPLTTFLWPVELRVETSGELLLVLFNGNFRYVVRSFDVHRRSSYTSKRGI